MGNSEEDLRLSPENPTPHQRPNPAMDRLRARIATELAALKPSALVGTAAKRLHSDVERRLFALVSNLRIPTHPPYASMVHRAIEELNDGGGLSEKAISEFIVREYENLPLGHDGILRHHLAKLCQRGEVVCTVDGRYSLQVDGGSVTAFKKGVVGVERKHSKKKRGRKRGVSRPIGVKDRGGEEKKGGEIGEENRWIEQEIEVQTEAQEMRIDGTDEEKKGKEEREELVGKLDQGSKEEDEAIEEQSEAEKRDMEVTEEQIQMTGRKLNDRGSNDEEISQASINEKAKANEKKEDIEAGEQQHKTIKEQKLGRHSEQHEPRPEQTEVIERQDEEEVRKEQQQEKAKLNNKTISASSFNEENIEVGEQHTEMIKEQKLGMSSEPKEIQPQQAGVIEEQIQLEEVQKQHQDCCGQQDKTQEKHKITSSMPTATTPLVGPINDGQHINLEKQSARKMKLSVPQQQDLHQSQLQRRKLRSYTWSGNPESAASSTTLELSPLSQQHDELQQLHEGQEKQDQWRPPKQKRYGKTNMQTALPFDSHPHHEEQPPKRCRVEGMHLKPTPDAEAIKEASSAQLQNEQQHNQAQLLRRILRSHNKNPSISESAKPTVAFSSLPSRKQDMQRQQARCQGRLHKQKIDADINVASSLSLVSQHHKEDLPLKDHGRRRSPRLKTDTGVEAGSTVSSASQYHQGDKQPPKQHGGGRTTNLNTDTMLNAGSALSLALQDHKGEDEQRLKIDGQGRPSQHHAEDKQFVSLNEGSALCLDSQHQEEAVEQPPKRLQKRRWLGRPPNPIPSAYMLKKYGKRLLLGKGRPPNTVPSAYTLKKYGKRQLPGKGRGRHSKAKQDPKRAEDVILPSNTHLEKLKQKHTKGLGPERSPKPNEDLQYGKRQLPGRGRPPKAIPSAYMLKKYGKRQLPGKGRGRHGKAKQDPKRAEAVILPSNTHLEKLKQKHTKGLGPERPPKPNEDLQRFPICRCGPKKMAEEGPWKPKLDADTVMEELENQNQMHVAMKNPQTP